jgi:hypothetical protein
LLLVILLFLQCSTYATVVNTNYFIYLIILLPLHCNFVTLVMKFCRDNIGKEVISRYTTGWATDGLFYTDSNGREVLERKRNYRPTWDVTIDEPESGNYYPITTSLYLKSGSNVLAVLPDRAEGGSSLIDGDLELMLHRRLLHDDGYGVGEALNEMAYGTGLVARGRHIVIVGNSTETPTTIARQRQLIQSRNVLAPWLVFTPTQLTLQEWSANYHTEVCITSMSYSYLEISEKTEFIIGCHQPRS